MDEYFNKLFNIQANNKNKVFYFYQAVNNNKDIFIYFAIMEVLKQVNNIISRDISPRVDQ